jgi:hypothetical protein
VWIFLVPTHPVGLIATTNRSAIMWDISKELFLTVCSKRRQRCMASEGAIPCAIPNTKILFSEAQFRIKTLPGMQSSAYHLWNAYQLENILSWSFQPGQHWYEMSGNDEERQVASSLVEMRSSCVFCPATSTSVQYYRTTAMKTQKAYLRWGTFLIHLRAYPTSCGLLRKPIIKYSGILRCLRAVLEPGSKPINGSRRILTGLLNLL